MKTLATALFSIYLSTFGALPARAQAKTAASESEVLRSIAKHLQQDAIPALHADMLLLARVYEPGPAPLAAREISDATERAIEGLLHSNRDAAAFEGAWFLRHAPIAPSRTKIELLKIALQNDATEVREEAAAGFEKLALTVDDVDFLIRARAQERLSISLTKLTLRQVILQSLRSTALAPLAPVYDRKADQIKFLLDPLLWADPLWPASSKESIGRTLKASQNREFQKLGIYLLESIGLKAKLPSFCAKIYN